MSGNLVIDEAENILKKLLRLIQISSNPFLVDKGYHEIPAKFSILDGLLEDIDSRNEKAIIWTNFIENITVLVSRFKQYNPVVIYGDIPIKDRAEIVKTFSGIKQKQVDDCKSFSRP